MSETNVNGSMSSEFQEMEVKNQSYIVGGMNLEFQEMGKNNLVQQMEVKKQKIELKKVGQVNEGMDLGFQEMGDENLVQEIDVNGSLNLGFQEMGDENLVQEIDVNGGLNLGFQETGEENLFQEIDVNGGVNVGFQEMGEENLVQEIEVRKQKRQRRRGRGKKKDDGIGKDSSLMDIDFENERFVRVPREGVICYTVKEMWEMRFVGEEEQRKKWVEVYCGLEPEIKELYDSLTGSKNQKQHSTVDFDPRHQRIPAVDNKPVNGDVAVSDISASIQNSHPIAEEQFFDDEESDEEYDTILRPAFYVSGEPDFDYGPPQDGLEYLRRVRWEAAQIPKVKVVKVDKSKLMSEQTAYMPQIPEIAKCPDHLLPLKTWEDTFLADFSQLRQALSHSENATDILNGEQPVIFVSDKAEMTPNLSSYIVETFEGLTAGGEAGFHSSDACSADHSSGPMTSLVSNGNDAPDTIENPSCQKVVKDNNANHPTLSAILNMEPVARVSSLRKRIRSLENMSYFSKEDCLWIFALCASIDTPLDADTSASFRSLLRKCASLRSQKTEIDDEVMMLNILATISGRYFGQLESGWA